MRLPQSKLLCIAAMAKAGFIERDNIMQETCDAVVVGAGLNGAATAYFLLKKGFRRVIILDAGLAGSGASGAAVGLLRSHYDNFPETELAAKSMPYFRNWSDMVGGDCGWRPTGFLRFVEHHELENMRENVRVQRTLGEVVSILDGNQVRSLAPEFRVDDIGAAVYERDTGTASNSLATYTMLKQACANGAELRPFTRAMTIDVENGRVTGVVTDKFRIATPVVVLAAGTWSKEIAASCGVDLPLTARLIRVAEILPPDNIQLSVSYMDPITDSWATPRQQGRAIITVPHPKATMAIDLNNYDGEFTRADAEVGLVAVQKRVPGIDASIVTRWWSRPDCFAPDGKPILGDVEAVAGLFLNTASAGKGHKVAPAAGLALSELIADGCATTADITRFGLNRFDESLKPWSATQYGKRAIG